MGHPVSSPRGSAKPVSDCYKTGPLLSFTVASEVVLERNYFLPEQEMTDFASSLRDECSSVVRTPRTALRLSWAISDTPSGSNISSVSCFEIENIGERQLQNLPPFHGLFQVIAYVGSLLMPNRSLCRANLHDLYRAHLERISILARLLRRKSDAHAIRIALPFQLALVPKQLDLPNLHREKR